MGFGEKIRSWLLKLFELDRFEFDKVVVSQEVADNICELANQAHPKEFIAFLEGKVKDKALRIQGLMYQEYYASKDSTLSKIYLPLNTNVVGSVHSHPGPSNSPSTADLHFFNKHGMFHMIIKRPYKKEDIQAYGINGQKLTFEIG